MSNRALFAPLLLLFFALFGCASEKAPNESPRGFVIVDSENLERPNFHDFGEVPHGEVANHLFKIVNTDPVPITIRDLDSSCGCTVPSIYYVDLAGHKVKGNVRAKGKILVVPPGATVFIDMKTDTTEVGVMNMDKLAMVRLRCDSKNTAFMTFELHLIVRLLFQATPLEISMGQIAASTGGSAFSEIIAAVTGSSARILDIQSSDPAIETSVTESIRFGTTLWTLTARVPANFTRGPYRSEVILRTTDPDGEGDAGRFKIGIAAQVVPDIMSAPHTASLGTFARSLGASVTTTIRTLVPGQRFKVAGYEVIGEGGDELEIELSPVDPDSQQRATSWVVSLSIAPGASLDAYAGKIELKLDDTQTPSFSLPFNGRVIAQ